MISQEYSPETFICKNKQKIGMVAEDVWLKEDLVLFALLYFKNTTTYLHIDGNIWERLEEMAGVGERSHGFFKTNGFKSLCQGFKVTYSSWQVAIAHYFIFRIQVNTPSSTKHNLLQSKYLLYNWAGIINKVQKRLGMCASSMDTQVELFLSF